MNLATEPTKVQTLCCLVLSFFNYWEMSLLETFDTHSCVICISSCPLLKCTAMTGYCVLRSQWTGIVCVLSFFFFFCSHSVFHFHEKKQKVWVSDTLIEMSDGKLHFWGGANIVGPIFVIVHLLAPVSSLNGSSPCGLTVRLVWARVGDTAPVF